ncbi:MAG: hypothetical protein JO100_19110 [Pseudonocardia sp.]|nr:hypothetical protein [Pseudonocardia sp.]
MSTQDELDRAFDAAEQELFRLETCQPMMRLGTLLGTSATTGCSTQLL